MLALRRVDLVGDVVERLQIVARIDVGERNELEIVVGVEEVPFGEFRHLVVGAHVGEDETVTLKGRIRALADLFGQTRTAVRLARHLHQPAVHVELEAVVAAADAGLLYDAVLERGTPVRTVAVQDADLSRLVAERHEFLAHDLDRLGYVGEFFGHADRLPEPTQEFPHRLVRVGVRQLGVFCRDVAFLVAAVFPVVVVTEFEMRVLVVHAHPARLRCLAPTPAIITSIMLTLLKI